MKNTEPTYEELRVKLVVREANSVMIEDIENIFKIFHANHGHLAFCNGQWHSTDWASGRVFKGHSGFSAMVAVAESVANND
jgi:hypothetical protein